MEGLSEEKKTGCVPKLGRTSSGIDESDKSKAISDDNMLVGPKPGESGKYYYQFTL